MENEEICIHRFELTRCKDLLGNFVLEFRGLFIPECGVFYSRKGKLDFELPYQAQFEMCGEDYFLVLKKLAAIIDERKAKDPENWDKPDDEIPF